jgi:hypothetical protein
MLREDFCLKHLWGVVLRIGVEILHQALKIRGFGSWGKGRSAPVVQHCSGQIRSGGWRELLDDQFFAAQARLTLRGGSHGYDEAVLRAMLLS